MSFVDITYLLIQIGIYSVLTACALYLSKTIVGSRRFLFLGFVIIFSMKTLASALCLLNLHPYSDFILSLSKDLLPIVSAAVVFFLALDRLLFRHGLQTRNPQNIKQQLERMLRE